MFDMIIVAAIKSMDLQQKVQMDLPLDSVQKGQTPEQILARLRALRADVMRQKRLAAAVNGAAFRRQDDLWARLRRVYTAKYGPL